MYRIKSSSISNSFFSTLLRLCSIITLLSLISIATSLPFSPPASAEVKTNNLIRATLLGDSYSAGNGAGDYYGPKESYRSHNNWAHKYTRWLNDQGAPTTLENLAYSGSVTSDVLHTDGKTNQIDKMSADTNLVMFTIGGNDVNFSDIVQQCFALGMRDAKTCKEKVTNANTQLENVKTNTLTILQQIDDKLTNDAQVILVGYPRLASNREYILKDDGVEYNEVFSSGVMVLVP